MKMKVNMAGVLVGVTMLFAATVPAVATISGIEPPEVMVFYKEKENSLKTLAKVRVFLEPYKGTHQIRYVLITDPANAAMMRSLGLPREHFPFALAVNGKTSAKINGKKVVFAHFPDFMHHVGRHKGNWTLNHLERVLRDPTLMLTDNPRVETLPGGGEKKDGEKSGAAAGSDAGIMQRAEAVIRERIDRHQGRFGIVLGIIDGTGSRIVAYGRAEGDRPVNRDSLFNTGSVSKLFTATLLADMVERGEVSLDDEIGRFLPPGVKTPARKGRGITLLDLATHTSGLPSTPGNSSPSRDGRPGYCDYSEKQLLAFLSGYRMTRDIGGEYQYSNLGMGLLGYLLSRHAGKPLDDLLEERIWRPLQMKRTGSREKLAPLYPDNMTVSYHADGSRASDWPMSPVLKGAGGYYSSVPDILNFLGAHMGLIRSPLSKAMRRTQKGYRSTGSPGGAAGLGWGISTSETEHYLSHSGGTAAYSSFVGIDKKRGRGVVILGNSYFEVIDIGVAVLADRLEMPAAEQTDDQRKYEPGPEDRAAWKGFAGLYRMSPVANAMVTFEKGRLCLQVPLQPRLLLSPTGGNSFAGEQGGISVTLRFLRDGQGNPHAVEITQGAAKATLEKISAPETLPVDPGVLDACEGLFAMEDDRRLEITRQGDSLYAQVTLQPRIQIFYAGGNAFFSMLDDMKITFIRNDKGEGNELIYRHQGREKRGKRVREKAAAAADPAGFGDYVGEYRVTPRFTLTVTMENQRLFIQGSFQPVFELIPEGKDCFYIKTVDARIRFKRDPKGLVDQIVVSTSGGDEIGNRIAP